MTLTSIPIDEIGELAGQEATAMKSIRLEEYPARGRREAAALAAAENQRFLDLVRSLEPGDWSKPTDCPAWDVRALTSHLVGAMEAFSSVRVFIHQMRAGTKAKGDRPFIDGMTEVQVRERAHLGPPQLVERLTVLAPRSARARQRVPALLRRMPMKQEMAGGGTETWRLGYLLDIILTRDTWIHRVDIARATGRELVLDASHDGKIVAEVVAEWARRHRQPMTLRLEGPAGGAFIAGDGGDAITMDAVEFCRTVSGRSPGAGLLAQAVPF